MVELYADVDFIGFKMEMYLFCDVFRMRRPEMMLCRTALGRCDFISIIMINMSKTNVFLNFFK